MTTDTAASAASSRDFALDCVRAIAIIEVVLAHSDLPPLLMQLRNFGVPLLLLISGMTFGMLYRDRQFSSVGYLARRVRKLLLPTWAFLAFYFVLSWLLYSAGVFTANHSGDYIIDSFLLSNDASYVWVIRVNLLMSLVAGLLLLTQRRLTSGLWLGVVILAALTLNELLFSAYTGSDLPGTELGQIIRENLFYTLAYGAIFLLGMRLPSLSRSTILALAVCSLLAFLVIGAWLADEARAFVPTQEFKYPPRLYYIAFAMAVSLLILAFRNELAALVPAGWPRRLVGFIGSHTLDIYLWHILALRLVSATVRLGYLPSHWVVTWIATVALAVLFTWLFRLLWRRVTGSLPKPGAPQPS